jgi:transcriptional regulator with XRE-family HTH domain
MTTTASETKARLTDQVAGQIRALLGLRRLSGRELARRMGASYSWVNFRLTGAQAINLDDLQRFADALGVDVLDLIPDREGRVVTHIGAPRVQTTVPKVALPRKPRTFGPRGRQTPNSRIRRPELIVSAAA